MPNFDFPQLGMLPHNYVPQVNLPPITDPHWASEYHTRLKEYVRDFEKALKEDEDVALRLVSFGETIIIIVESIGYYNPGLICFYGTDREGNRVQLIQNVAQLSFLLMAVKTTKPKEQRRRIGFKPDEEL